MQLFPSPKNRTMRGPGVPMKESHFEKYKIDQEKSSIFEPNYSSFANRMFCWSLIAQGLLELDGRNCQKYLHQT